MALATGVIMTFAFSAVILYSVYTVKNYDGRTLGEAKKAIAFYLIAARWESGNGTND